MLSLSYSEQDHFYFQIVFLSTTVSTLTKLSPPQGNSLSSSLYLNDCLMKESYSLFVAAFYAFRAGGIKMNAKQQQVSSIQALQIISENLDSVAQRSLCRSTGFRLCVVCLGILTFFFSPPIDIVLSSPSKPCSFINGHET